MDGRNSQEIVAPKPQMHAARPSQLGTRRTAMRVMQRKSVGMVAVYEQDPVAPRAGTRTLVFETLKGKVQTSDFPADWQRLSDDELAKIRKAAGAPN